MNSHAKVKQTNELITLRKRKIIIRRSVLLFILLTAVLVTVCLKLPYFTVKSIEVTNNKIISSKEIVNQSGILLGNNIFYINIKSVKHGVLSNPYITGVNVKRQLPDKILLDVKERKATFYSVKGSKYIVLDSNAIVLESRDSIDGFDLVKVDGLNLDTIELGKVVESEESRKTKALKTFADLIYRNTSSVKISAIDLNDLLNINVGMSKMLVKFGSNDDIEVKLNKVINMLNLNEIKNAKGYIDVSFEGNPVVHVEN